jgi:hypothetical protein
MVQDLYIQYPYCQGGDYVNGLGRGTSPYNRECWIKTWAEIYKIKGLKQVRVDMYVPALCIHAGHEEIFFTPLEGLRDEVEVEVRVSWRLDPPEGKHVWPFSVRRRAAYHAEDDGSFVLGDVRPEK